MKRILVMVLIVGVLVLAIMAQHRDDVHPRVSVDVSEIRVVDGDTIRWRGERVRLTGFDAPEIFSPQCPSELTQGRTAAAALLRDLQGATVIELATFPRKDRYGRIVATLWLDGQDVAERMVAAGFARFYDGGQRHGWCP